MKLLTPVFPISPRARQIAGLLLAGLALAPGPLGAGPAPTRVYPEPSSFLLLRLGGDRAHSHYTPGSLDRTANLKARLEIVARSFERWTKLRVEYTVFVLGRREWEEAGIDVEYGIPVRVGTSGIAVPARGDAGTVELWSGLLGGMLPSVAGTPLLGSPQEAASLIVADVVAQVLAGQILADVLGLVGDEPWIRGAMAHLAALTVVLRQGTDRPEDLAVLYRRLLSRHPPKTFSLRDDRDGLAAADWLWFQAQYHFGARAIYDKEGKDALKKMHKLSSKGKLTASQLRRKHKALGQWLDDQFAAVSRQR
ncbi:MAG TPA: hypothetical protein VGG06_16105 [Thermoanaerobaculia bacterium]|jgi:hypothetical protein